MKRDGNKQRGAVTIVEAAFVFPIMFIVIFILLMTGEAYYQYSRVENAVTVAAVQGAARCENPMLGKVISDGKVPTSTTDTHVYPYRYIFTGQAKTIASEIKSDLENKISNMDSIAFKGMKPANANVTVTPKLNVLISSLTVECRFDILLPINYPFTSDQVKYSYYVKTVESIGDPSEFVRNVSMVKDLIERSQFQEQLDKLKDKMKNSKITQFLN